MHFRPFFFNPYQIPASKTSKLIPFSSFSSFLPFCVSQELQKKKKKGYKYEDKFTIIIFFHVMNQQLYKPPLKKRNYVRSNFLTRKTNNGYNYYPY